MPFQNLALKPHLLGEQQHKKYCEVVFFLLGGVTRCLCTDHILALGERAAHIVQKMCNIIGDARLFQLLL